MIKIIDSADITAEQIIPRYSNKSEVADIVADIIDNVRKNGDAALIDYAAKFDKAKIDSVKVSDEEIDEAMSLVEPQFIEVLTQAKENIYQFHRRQLRDNFIVNDNDGVILGQKFIPLSRVGLYVPGGTAAYRRSRRD